MSAVTIESLKADCAALAEKVRGQLEASFGQSFKEVDITTSERCGEPVENSVNRDVLEELARGDHFDQYRPTNT